MQAHILKDLKFSLSDNVNLSSKFAGGLWKISLQYVKFSGKPETLHYINLTLLKETYIKIVLRNI